jgi:hypothetical protein
MKIFLFAAAFIFSSLILLSCKKDNPVPPDQQPQVSLTLEDVSCTEAWIKLSTSNISLPIDVELQKDGNFYKTISLILPDTILYIDSLLPNKAYSFKSVIQSSNQSIISAPINITTIDTTSHNLNWQVFLFGQHQHSRINDISIIDENNIWAVGEIYLLDSLGQQDVQPYGVSIWNGQTWELKKLFYNNNIPVTPRGILVINSRDIYLASGSIFHWDGTSSTVQMVYSRLSFSDSLATIEKLWGRSEMIYGVGHAGTIVSYENGQWGRIESGTDVDLYDIWGDKDGTIWACGYSDDYSISALLRYNGNGIETVYLGNSSDQNNGFYIGPISGVWGASYFRIYMMNWSGIYTQANSNKFFLEKEITRFSDVGFGIDGTDDNNIFACGEGFVGHWNGISYKEYPELYKDSRTFYSVCVKGNTVCAGGTDYNGYIYSQAVIVLSK